MTIFDGGWQSVTTKSRLNALCDYFCVDGEGVFQKDFQWYVKLFVGAINGEKVYKTEISLTDILSPDVIIEGLLTVSSL